MDKEKLTMTIILVLTILSPYLYTKTQAFMIPYTRSPLFLDAFFPPDYDPFKILEHTPVTIPKGTEHTPTSIAHADWKETPKAHIILLDVPGMKKEDMKIEVEENRVLRVSGERRQEDEMEKERWHRAERATGKFWRQFRMPVNVDLHNVRAQLGNGVLKITVPKVVEEKKREAKVIAIAEDGNVGGEDIKATKADM